MPTKIHSQEVTIGPERAGARAMLRAVGLGEEDWVKPQIGVVSAGNEVTPCNLTGPKLSEFAKQGVRDAGGVGLIFTTIAVSDGISMGHEGMRASLVSPRGDRRLGRAGHACRTVRRHGLDRRL